MSGQGRATEGRPTRGASTIVVTCAFVVLLEGYDQSVYGAVLPVLVRDPAWNLSNAQAGYVGSAAFVGMLIGALTSGWLAARISRRSVVVGCLAIMAVFGTWCALATTGTTLGVLRFLTGVGLGGVLPLTSTITLAVAPGRVRSMTYAAMFAAIPIGGLLGAVLAIPVIPGWGPMVMFALPLPLIVVAIALSWFCLPDTPAGADGVESVPHPTSQVGFRGALLLPTVLLIAVLVGTMATPTQAVLYLLIFLAGTGAQGGLVVLNSVVDRSYPPWLRAQALGLTLGIGRIGAIIAPSVVGLIVGQSTVGSFSLFASCAVAAAILIALARRSQGLKRVTEMEGGNLMPAQNL